MSDYSIWVLDESSVSLTGGVTLDGITQGDGSHLVGQTLTINSVGGGEVFVSDASTDMNFADNDGNQTLNGAQTIDGVTYADGTRIEAEYQFIARDPATRIEYRIVSVNINNSSPSFGTVEGLAFVDVAPPVGTPLTIISASEGPSNNGSGALPEGNIVPICFCGGTLIETDRGPRPVEDLVSGDKVMRLDGSFATLRAVLETALSRVVLLKNPKLRPVRIKAGALGQGRPRRDLLVSRQHRMLVTSKVAERMFGEREVLVSAIRLTCLPGIHVEPHPVGLTYYHLVFDCHEVVLAEDVPTESLFPGPEALKSIGPSAREELLTIFPNLCRQASIPSARSIPTGKRQKRLIERHRINAKALLEAADRGSGSRVA